MMSIMRMLDDGKAAADLFRESRDWMVRAAETFGPDSTEAEVAYENYLVALQEYQDSMNEITQELDIIKANMVL